MGRPENLTVKPEPSDFSVMERSKDFTPSKRELPSGSNHPTGCQAAKFTGVDEKRDSQAWRSGCL